MFCEQTKWQQSCADNLLEFLKYTSKFMNKDNQKIVSEIQRLQTLKTHLNISISLTELRDPKLRHIRLNESVSVLIEHLQLAKSTAILTHAWSNCLLLAKSLDLNEIYTIVQLLKKVKNLQFTCEMAKLVLELKSITSADVLYYVELAVLLIVQEMNALETGTIMWN